MKKHACYLCGAKDRKLTKDHLPPKSFFPKPRPMDLITMPCCTQCHGQLSLDDEAFLVWVSSVYGASEAGKQVLKDKVFGSSFVRSPKLRENVAKHVSVRQLKTGGQLFSVPTITIPQERAKSFLVRLTKGLLTRFHPEYDYSSDTFLVRVFAPTREHADQIQDCAKRLTWDSRGTGVFDFWHGVVSGGGGAMWLYCFYGAAWCQVIHMKKPPKALRDLKAC